MKRMDGKIHGMWKDSTDNEYEVSFNEKWGDHYFTLEEQNKLLAGEEICFRYKGKDITGHLQYYFFEGRTSFRFVPNFDPKYVSNPVFQGSSFQLDIEREKVMAQFMALNYYERLINDDGSPIEYQRITEKKEQEAGVDVEFTQNGLKYVVDEKAQMDYIYNDKPLPTFALEITGVKGSEGWFVKQGLKTQYYMFIWPHANSRPLTLDGIEYAYYALVKKSRLQEEIASKYGTRDRLLGYAHRVMAGELGYEQNNKVYYKEAPFDQQGYLVYTKSPSLIQAGKEEEPVNLVVRRNWLESMAVSYGIAY